MNKTKKVIFETAIKEFSQNGYSGATMDNIAESAGVAKGTLYYHFKSKEEIFKYIITAGMGLMNEEVKNAADSQEDILNKLRAICKVQLEMVHRNRDFFKVVMSQLWGQELRHLELRESIKRYISVIETYLNEAMEKGVIKKGEPSFFSYAFFGTLCSAAVYELINNDLNNVDDVIESLMEYVLKGIQL
ncbi:TetR/AcrR family transcriptional regulator [Clostridium sp. SYSU_GA19001]|uniref:TetR/AcrR family transcriptional regulator n=1 Tax=Clostridium caldaquaticum TaxID=2940653 RepID=UPI0020772CBD|nr:TetR/AcrR family transcriptional regulator [Clostridium caldaquaticum]MCM8711580.1 TetR/AcrR family transcriptional regulator [Clostridium caldaquaticum]